MNRYIPLSIPNFEGNEIKYVNDALEQGWVSTGGAYITALEQKIADFVSTEAVVACQSGTSAIHLALIDAEIGVDDMVIVPTLTFIAAVNPVRYQFATPIFMDCDESLCIDPIKLESFCKEECVYQEGKLIHKETHKYIKAIIVVHVFGNLADMESIMAIAKRYNLIVIEDATEALGSYFTSGEFAGKYAGTIGNYGAYSFNGNKIITTGGGGAVVADKKERAEHIRYLSTQAKDDPLYYVHDEVGYNYRMTNLQAALGVAQMEQLAEFIERKNKNYDRYRELLTGFSIAGLKEYRSNTHSNKWFYALEIDMCRINGTLKDIITRLNECGVQTRAIWGLIHEQRPYRNAPSYKIEKAKQYSSCILNIPCSTQIKEEEIQFTVEKIKMILRELANG